MKNNKHKLEQFEQLLEHCQVDAKYLESINKKLPDVINRLKELELYYKNDYMDDLDNESEHDRTYGILDQDSIWNLLVSQQSEKIKIIKSLINSIEN
ncbi:DUF4298 domain-containing protein [Aquimarina longa]|uniref:DUF4298 domain-containing protein n=1 Tax=Aquimarina longa TaxID=1080221 RepID=UPI000780AAFC|nr:DUF4298 domain-containing protein [Aquimarina longa]